MRGQESRAAREARLDRLAQRLGILFIATVLPVLAYSSAAVAGAVPAMPWSPLGQAQQRIDQGPPPVRVPDGWAPAVPPQPAPAGRPADAGVSA